MQEVIKIFLVCKSDIFFRCIESLLKTQGIIFSGGCADPPTALTQSKESGADIIIMDANWNNRGYSGKQILEEFLGDNREVKILMVSGVYDAAQVCCLRKSGATGYFARDSTGLQQIIHCIQQVYRGELCFWVPF